MLLFEVACLFLHFLMCRCRNLKSSTTKNINSLCTLDILTSSGSEHFLTTPYPSWTMCEPRLSPPCAPLRFFLNVKYLTITFCVPQYCIPQVQVLSTYFLDPADSVRCPTLPASAPILRFFTHQASYHHLICPSVLQSTGPNIVHVLAISC